MPVITHTMEKENCLEAVLIRILEFVISWKAKAVTHPAFCKRFEVLNLSGSDAGRWAEPDQADGAGRSEDTGLSGRKQPPQLTLC